MSIAKELRQMKIVTDIFFLLILLVFSSYSLAKPERHVFDVQHGAMLEAMVDVGFVATMLPLDGSGSSKHLQTLSEYYRLAVAHDITGLRNIHFGGDGSRERFDEEIKRIPQKYEGFSNLQSVELGRIFAWGKYSAIEVKWKANDGSVVNWMELIHCSDSCHLSDRLYKSNADFEFLSAFIQLAKKAKVVKSSANKFISICPSNDASCGNPLGVSFPYKKFDFPIIINKSENEKTTKDKKYYRLEKSLYAVWKVSDEKLAGHSSYQGLTTLAVDTFKCCLPFIMESHMFPYLSDSFSKVFLTPVALFETFRKIKRVELMGSFQYGAAEYVYARVTNSSAVTSQLFVFESGPNKDLILVAQAKDFSIHSLAFHSEVVMEYVSE